MKKAFFYVLLCLVPNLTFTQSDDAYYSSIMNLRDTSFVEETKGSNPVSYYGRDFTPRGTFRVKVIFAGFYSPPVFFEDQHEMNNWPASDAYNNHSDLKVNFWHLEHFVNLAA